MPGGFEIFPSGSCGVRAFRMLAYAGTMFHRADLFFEGLQSLLHVFNLLCKSVSLTEDQLDARLSASHKRERTFSELSHVPVCTRRSKCDIFFGTLWGHSSLAGQACEKHW